MASAFYVDFSFPEREYRRVTLLGTRDFGITFQKSSGLELVAFADADYASKATDRRSVSGGAVMCRCVCVLVF